MRSTRKLLTAAMAGCLGLLIIPATAARADIGQVGTPLPIASFYQVVADTGYGYLFFSQDGNPTDNAYGKGLVVTNVAGQEVATIDPQDLVAGMALSADGSTLYAALPSAHAVTAISTASLQAIATYPLPDGDVPADVALQSGRLWVSYDTQGPATPGIGDFDLSSVKPAFQTPAAMSGPIGGWYAAPELAADPDGSGALVAALPAQSVASVTSYDVAGGRVTVRSSTFGFDACENETDLAVTPGGKDFILACGFPDSDYEYSTADLSQQWDYPAAAYPDAVAIAPNGSVAAGEDESTDAPDLFVYRAGASTPELTHQFEDVTDPQADLNPDIIDRGLAWSADGSTLYAVLQTTINLTGEYEVGYSLAALAVPGTSAPSLSLTTSALTYPYDSTIHVTASLGPSGANRTVAIYADPVGGARRLIASGRVGASGTLTVSYPAAQRSAMFVAAFTGDATNGPRLASRFVGVGAKVAATISGYYASKKIGSETYRLYHRTARLAAAVTVTPKLSGQCVALEAQQKVNGTWRPSSISTCGKLSAASTVRGYLTLGKATLGRYYRVRADYVRSISDARNVSTAGGWLYFMVEK